MDSFREKEKANAGILPDASHDGITKNKNLELYDVLIEKCEKTVFKQCPGNIGETLSDGREKFNNLSICEQISCLMNIIMWFNDVGGGCDLEIIGGASASGTKRLAMKLSSWTKNHSDVRLIDASASGLFESQSENLMELL